MDKSIGAFCKNYNSHKLYQFGLSLWNSRSFLAQNKLGRVFGTGKSGIQQHSLWPNPVAHYI